MLGNTDIECTPEPVSDNFSWRHARISLLEKVLNIWDADPISKENMSDWAVIAEKINNADVWVQLEYEGEPFPRQIIEGLINKHLCLDDKLDIRRLRGVILRIPRSDECNRYAKAQVLFDDPDAPEETKVRIARAIDGDWTAGCFALLDYKYFGLNDSELKFCIFKMLLSSESNIKLEENSQN